MNPSSGHISDVCKKIVIPTEVEGPAFRHHFVISATCNIMMRTSDWEDDIRLHKDPPGGSDWTACSLSP
jgi:hypothetical protein